MSRKYLNDKYCVRCGRKTPTPYLRDNWESITNVSNPATQVLDLGCGNGRNSSFLKKKGFNVVSLDMVNDYGKKCMLGHDSFPIADASIDTIICNYLLMFLNKKEREQVIQEIQRIASPVCYIMVELYAAKDSEAKTKETLLKLQKEIFKSMNWAKVKYSQGRFIAKRSQDYL